MREKSAASACLLGEECRYDGCSNKRELPEGCIAVCPEVMGGLPIPREPAEIAGGDGGDVLDGRARVVTKSGRDVTGEFIKGAEKAVGLLKSKGVECVYVKGKSPSCGATSIYDGSFSGRLKEGRGVFAELAARNGIKTEEIK